jgi:hypothetical protein
MQNPSPLATWAAIPDWLDWYEASDTGLIRSVTRTLTLSDGRVRTFHSQVLSPGTGEYGHQNVTLYRQGEPTGARVHQLVMRTFVGPPPEGMVVCHNDGDATNNRLSNLRYDTPRENTFDNVRNGTHHYAKRDACKWEHPFNEPNTMPGVGESRNCRACWMAGKVVKKGKGNVEAAAIFQAVSDVFYMRVMAGGEIEQMPPEQRERYIQLLTAIGKPPKRRTTVDDVAAVLKLLALGDNNEVIAEKVGISSKTVSQIKIGKHPLHRVSTLRKPRTRRTGPAGAQEAS